MTESLARTSDNTPLPSDDRSMAVRLGLVSKSFAVRDGDATHALQGIDLDIAAGEFISLIGPSGCGKSTLLRIVGDLIEPTAGTVEVNGKPARQARADRDYGIVFQTPVLFEWRSVEANVRLPLEVSGIKGLERERRVREMLELVELSGFERHYPHQLSGGMQQRVAIARALALQPALLLMDEPFGALDEMTRERLNAEVLRIWQATGKTVIFVTHSIPEAVFLSTRVVVMSPRPGRSSHVIDIDLPQPRNEDTRESDRYYELVTEVREALRGRSPEVAEAGAPAVAERLRAEGSFG
ncbi:ABC transporter ATP-binding protein [soil metagenome]